MVYCREWQLGYDKLPPLPWWLVEIVHRLIPGDFGFYLLAQVAVALAGAAQQVVPHVSWQAGQVSFAVLQVWALELTAPVPFTPVPREW